eukprot:2360941-Amphidinium_carterae.3
MVGVVWFIRSVAILAQGRVPRPLAQTVAPVGALAILCLGPSLLQFGSNPPEQKHSYRRDVMAGQPACQAHFLPCYFEPKTDPCRQGRSGVDRDLGSSPKQTCQRQSAGFTAES